MLYLLLFVEVLLVARLLPAFGLLAAIVIGAIFQRFRPRHASTRVTGAPPRFLILIPAHDEADVIATTVVSCHAIDYPHAQFQVLVIADNCTDSTSVVAETAGALVVVRSDVSRKSKGFALDDFFRGLLSHPDLQPADAVVLVDADTSVAANLLQAFAESLQEGADFIQGYYSVRNADASWRTQLMTYAFSLANGVWLAGADAIGLSVGLKGNGMCFRTVALERFPWRVHGLVEDMEFAWALRTGGERVHFEPRAQVYGEMVSRGGTGAASQRRRWESGRHALRSIVRPQLWNSNHLSLGQKIAYQIELDFPPLSRLLILLCFASVLGGWGTWWSGAQPIWLGMVSYCASGWFLFLVYAMSPILVLKLPIRYVFSLIHLPSYMVWKLSLGLLRAPAQWVRTPREAKSNDNLKIL